MIDILDSVEQSKVCRGACKARKSLSEFSKRQSRCKICVNTEAALYRLNNPFKIKESNRLCRLKHKEKYAKRISAHHFYTKYGVTVDAIEDIKKLQEYRCKICRRLFTKFGKGRACIDHCHKSKYIRSILCSRCNLVEGELGSVRVARRMFEYMAQSHLLSYRE